MVEALEGILGGLIAGKWREENDTVAQRWVYEEVTLPEDLKQVLAERLAVGGVMRTDVAVVTTSDRKTFLEVKCSGAGKNKGSGEGFADISWLWPEVVLELNRNR